MKCMSCNLSNLKWTSLLINPYYFNFVRMLKHTLTHTLTHTLAVHTLGRSSMIEIATSFETDKG